ncbi:hypothetical protein [Brevundimonas variabilis]|uniref:Lipoprotein n=1 Tax=Brevundimonas variabilis TaxID=74312 RepID=A0A7W9CJG7_9CAUL|nr:hypothetical protein [Brevundimonas variabilis]MBB5746820.1 hypothetical protein [Brevundimonas variabilis]
MPRFVRAALIGAAVLLGPIGCASTVDAIDRRADALAVNLSENTRCQSRAQPDGQTSVDCTLWGRQRTTTKTTTTTTAADGTVTTTSSTRTVD